MILCMSVVVCTRPQTGQVIFCFVPLFGDWVGWGGVGQQRSFHCVLHMTFLVFLVVDLLSVGVWVGWGGAKMFVPLRSSHDILGFLGCWPSFGPLFFSLKAIERRKPWEKGKIACGTSGAPKETATVHSKNCSSTIRWPVQRWSTALGKVWRISYTCRMACFRKRLMATSKSLGQFCSCCINGPGVKTALSPTEFLQKLQSWLTAKWPNESEKTQSILASLLWSKMLQC